MSKDQRISSHSVTWLTVHIVWVTKYRYKVLTGDIQIRCRELVKQICDAEAVRLVKEGPKWEVKKNKASKAKVKIKF